MYNRFFGFKERPFKLVPNPEFIFLSRIHEEVLAHLNYAVGYGEGFVEITGEVGTGKTTLCRMFLESLGENTIAAYIFNPKLDSLQLLKAINDEFGISSDADSVKVLIDRLNAFLLEKKTQGKRVLLLVDEAQNLSADVLEQLRLLSNLETTTSKLIQIILVGQPELGALLESDALRQLNQRITLSCHLIPLNLSETREYIRHRIRIASRKPGLEFTARAYRSIFTFSGGVPRLINIVCDRALLTAFSLGKRHLSNRIVQRAIRELDGKRSRFRKRLVYREKIIFGVLAGLVVLVAGLIVNQTLLYRSGGLSVPPVAPQAGQKQSSAPDPAVTLEAAELTFMEVAELPPAPQPLAALPVESKPPLPASQPSETTPATLTPTVRGLDQVLDSVEAVDSLIGSLRAVLEAWGVQIMPSPEPVAGVSEETFLRISARHSDMEVLRVRGNLDLIERLNLPAILEFPYPDGGTRYLTVVGLADNEVWLCDGDEAFSITPASIAGFWNGVAHIFWKNYYNYTGVIPISSPGDVILSLKVHLKAMGFPISEISAAYDIATRQAVQAIQARHGLVVDGVVGPLTKIALYNEDRSLKVPQLVAVPSDEWLEERGH